MYGQYCKLHRVLLALLVLIKLYYLIIGSIGSKNRTVHYKALSSSIIWIIGVIFHFAGIDMAWSWSKQFVVCVLSRVGTDKHFSSLPPPIPFKGDRQKREGGKRNENLMGTIDKFGV